MRSGIRGSSPLLIETSSKIAPPKFQSSIINVHFTLRKKSLSGLPTHWNFILLSNDLRIHLRWSNWTRTGHTVFSEANVATKNTAHHLYGCTRYIQRPLYKSFIGFILDYTAAKLKKFPVRKKERRHGELCVRVGSFPLWTNSRISNHRTFHQHQYFILLIGIWLNQQFFYCNYF